MCVCVYQTTSKAGFIRRRPHFENGTVFSKFWCCVLVFSSFGVVCRRIGLYLRLAMRVLSCMSHSLTSKVLAGAYIDLCRSTRRPPEAAVTLSNFSFLEEACLGLLTLVYVTPPSLRFILLRFMLTVSVCRVS